MLARMLLGLACGYVGLEYILTGKGPLASLMSALSHTVLQVVITAIKH